MIEIDRILERGIVGEEYLKEETVCDFHVTKELKKVQAISLDILLKFDAVCKKHSLKYYLAFGTLLGAVRHKGFIPWDDDIDVLMPREDYERFVQMRDEFTSPYFLQTPQTDKGYLYSITKIRNSNTCNFSIQRGYWGWNGGIWIDIFPLDKCKTEDRAEIFQQIDTLNCYNSAFMKIPSPYMNEKGKSLLVNNLDLSPFQALNRITELSTKYRNEDVPYVTEYSTTIYKWDKITWKKEDYAATTEVEFCGYKFPAPIGYDSVLRTTYGDYMALPPVESRGHWHDGHILDTDRSYREILAEMNIKQY